MYYDGEKTSIVYQFSILNCERRLLTYDKEMLEQTKEFLNDL